MKELLIRRKHHRPLLYTAPAQIIRVTEAYVNHANYLLRPHPMLKSQIRVVIALVNVVHQSR